MRRRFDTLMPVELQYDEFTLSATTRKSRSGLTGSWTALAITRAWGSGPFGVSGI